MISIGAWRLPWMAAGLAAWVAAIGVHAAAMAGVDFPDEVNWALFIGIFPLFFVAVLSHPSVSIRGTNAHVGLFDSVRGASIPLIALAAATFVYALATASMLHIHHMHMDHHFSPLEMEVSSLLSAVFFVVSTMLHSSARSHEQIPGLSGP